jgi:hypothetical protein
VIRVRYPKEYPFSWYGVKTSGGPLVGQREKERERHGIKPTLKELAKKILTEVKK